MDIHGEDIFGEGAKRFKDALLTNVPIVGIFGQNLGWSKSEDLVLKAAFKHTQRPGSSWRHLLQKEPLSEGFYQWIAERFGRRNPSDELIKICDIPFSAIFTSSVDPSLINLLSTNGRQAEPIIFGNPIPTILRSIKRLPIFYLFGRAGIGVEKLDPPKNTQTLAQRRLQHAAIMLLNARESATALGLIVIDGYKGDSDWLKAEDLLAAISDASKGGIVWFGDEPSFDGDDLDTFNDLIENGIIIRENHSLSSVYEYYLAKEEIGNFEPFDEPELLTLQQNRKFIIEPQLRLLTEATASIVDNSWTGFLTPFNEADNNTAFYNFHSANIGLRARVEGIRREYVIERDFERQLYEKVDKAINKHHEQIGAIVLHGQSGVGKSIAISNLAIKTRTRNKVAVLMSSGNAIPQASELSPFLEEVDKSNDLTVILLDCNKSIQHYDELLFSLRSGGRRVVVVGTTYKQEENSGRFIHAPAILSQKEKDNINALSKRFTNQDFDKYINSDNALAKFYWSLPASRGAIAEGLSKETRFVETNLRIRGSTRKVATELTALAHAFVAIGYNEPTFKLFNNESGSDSFELSSPASRIIDYVMVTSRLYQSVPVNLLLRVILNNNGSTKSSVDSTLINELFADQDLFRWEKSGNQQNELLVSARLQIEAELVCNRRIGSPSKEAECIIELIEHAYRAGQEDNEEAKFVADIVYAIGPDGPTKLRYKNSYLKIARALTLLREEQGVMNARLMLQESTLRRHYIKNQEIDVPEKAEILIEATKAIDEALKAIDVSDASRLYAAKRTREHLFTERAAIYGYLATDSAQKNGSPSVTWASYKAARGYARLSAGRVLSYQPLDISLWVPIRVLKECSNLDELQRIEMLADIRSTLDLVDTLTLDSYQAELFYKQQLKAAEVLQDESITESAFNALDEQGSAAGYYLRAKKYAPEKPKNKEIIIINDKEMAAIDQASDYLEGVYPKISNDTRTMQLLISMKWAKFTKRWLFRGWRQPIPSSLANLDELRVLVTELKIIDENTFSPQFRYLEAMLQWLTGDERQALAMWRALAKDTDYSDEHRIANRHTITDNNGSPVIYSGVIIKSIGVGRWSVKVNGLNREVALVQKDFPKDEISEGRLVRNFSVSFSYRGPIADSFYLRGHR
ncbi:hypothetical protein [Serratia fonticola]|uniref:hypothetical protein n=1 Tax=Serratia fonticola TaxID=47917 RepID=UPI0016446598|nr:hypothetical protein [Serratia fonticola]MBC3216677.1 hypothetical protein [Serratia fonticola]